MVKKKKALKTDWDRCEPMPQKHIVVDFQHRFTKKDYETLQYGFIPEVMEDKWFIYYEDNKLNFYRSWTGFCIYIAEFDKHQICRVTINRDPEQYKEADDQWNCECLIYLIKVVLLGKNAHYPELRDVDPDIAAIQQWTQVGRAMLKEDE